jgi:2-deoxy-D-gluconate 3-dehydrogenase
MSTTSVPSRPSHPFDLTGRLAVVTGARRGIGLGIATALAEAGADLVGVSATMEEGASPLRAAVEGAGRSFTPMRADLQDRHAMDRVAERLLADHGPVDILVNNAGTIARVPAVDHDDDDWDRVIEVNLTSAFRLSRALAPGMIERGRGKIIFVGSIMSFQGGINISSYAASKHGLAGLTKSLSNDWARHGLNINAIAPGYIRTEANQTLQDDVQRATSIIERTPAGRWGDAKDIGGAAVFLASSASDYVNGVVLPVDGGWLGR